MKKVVIPKSQNSSLVAQLVSLYNVFKNVSDNEIVEFDMSQLDWLCPLLALPLSSYIVTTNSKFIGVKNEVQSYLNTVRFPNGIDSVSSFHQQILANKNYVPISVLRKEKGHDREQLETQFLEMINKILGNIPGAQNAVYYPIGELLTNIFEHSQKQEGFIFGQYYPQKNYLDICIVDCGRGLAKGYKDECNLDLSDEEAIIKVMEGVSTKADKERGFGVRTSKKVVCEAMGGEFVLISGSVALTMKTNSEKLVNLPDFNWQGVIVAYRIPKPTEAIDITQYLE